MDTLTHIRQTVLSCTQQAFNMYFDKMCVTVQDYTCRIHNKKPQSTCTSIWLWNTFCICNFVGDRRATTVHPLLAEVYHQDHFVQNLHGSILAHVRQLCGHESCRRVPVQNTSVSGVTAKHSLCATQWEKKRNAVSCLSRPLAPLS